MVKTTIWCKTEMHKQQNNVRQIFEEEGLKKMKHMWIISYFMSDKKFKLFVKKQICNLYMF